MEDTVKLDVDKTVAGNRFLPWLPVHKEIAIWRQRSQDITKTEEERKMYRGVAKRLADAQWSET